MLRRVLSLFGNALPRASIPSTSAAARVDSALAAIANVEASSRARIVAETTSDSATKAGIEGDSSINAAAHRAHHDPLLLARTALTDEQICQAEAPSGLCELAGALYAGVRVPRDTARAGALWLAAARAGHAGALLAVALASTQGVGPISRAPARARGMLGLLADRERLPPAQYALALLLLDDAGITGDGSGGKTLYTATNAARTSPTAVRALELFRAAADSGRCPPAFLNSANCLFAGVGTPGGEPDLAAGEVYLTAAARGGDGHAAADLAARIMRGEISGDKSIAAKWTRVAAEAAHPVAMYNEGVAALSGAGKDGLRDAAVARVWLQRAADAGYFRAAVNLGLLLARGAPPAVPRDSLGAISYLRSAIDIANAAVLRAEKSGRPPPSGIARTVQLITARVESLEAGETVDDDGANSELEVDFESTAARDAALDAIHGAQPGREGASQLQQLLLDASSAGKLAK